MASRHSYVRYLPVEKDALSWGLHVIDCGITDIPPGGRYPESIRHPINYRSKGNKGREGRTLSEFQLVYITRGTGIYESRKTGSQSVSAGDILVTFPNEWHNYRWSDETGWDECWVGFNGKYAEQLMCNFFFRFPRLLHVGFDLILYQMIRSLPEILEQARPGYQQILAAKTMEIIAQLRSLILCGGPRAKYEKMIQDIRVRLVAEIDQNIDFHALATSVGMSYSRFCTFFKEHTGYSPYQYVLSMRINRAKELLEHTHQRVSDIADVLGFESLYYFSRLFKLKTGYSPSEYRALYVND